MQEHTERRPVFLLVDSKTVRSAGIVIKTEEENREYGLGRDGMQDRGKNRWVVWVHMQIHALYILWKTAWIGFPNFPHVSY